jgi:S1-C subfamily serine protease
MNTSDPLSELSRAIAARAAAAKTLVAAIRFSEHRHLTGTIWQSDIVVASEQTLPKRDAYEVVAPGGALIAAQPAGRDPGTNIALLKLAQPVPAALPATSAPEAGQIALAYGADGAGGATARLGIVNFAGPEWHSRAGGRIDRRVVLDLQLGRAEEGGPVLDADGGLFGISTFGPRRRVLVIPKASIERVVPSLLKDGRVARGWLGVGLQLVAVPDALHQAAGQTGGLMVMSTAEGGPCAKAGVVAGDILLTVNGTPARRFRKVAAHLGADSVGKTADLRLIRAGSIISLQAVITARPEG